MATTRPSVVLFVVDGMVAVMIAPFSNVFRSS
jgi:hypothetical protein